MKRMENVLRENRIYQIFALLKKLEGVTLVCYDENSRYIGGKFYYRNSERGVEMRLAPNLIEVQIGDKVVFRVRKGLCGLTTSEDLSVTAIDYVLRTLEIAIDDFVDTHNRLLLDEKRQSEKILRGVLDDIIDDELY